VPPNFSLRYWIGISKDNWKSPSPLSGKISIPILYQSELLALIWTLIALVESVELPKILCLSESTFTAVEVSPLITLEELARFASLPLTPPVRVTGTLLEPLTSTPPICKVDLQGTRSESPTSTPLICKLDWHGTLLVSSTSEPSTFMLALHSKSLAVPFLTGTWLVSSISDPANCIEA